MQAIRAKRCEQCEQNPRTAHGTSSGAVLLFFFFSSENHASIDGIAAKITAPRPSLFFAGMTGRAGDMGNGDCRIHLQAGVRMEGE